MTNTAKDDPLLWQLRRSIIRAQQLKPGEDNHREALVLTAEISAHVRTLASRLSHIEGEMRAANQRVVAAKAYGRSAALGGRQKAVPREAK